MRLLSVIIPIYHGAKTVRRSLQSLADQQIDASTAEIVLAVNDGRADSYEAAQGGIPALEARGFAVRLLCTERGRRTAFAAAEEVATPGTIRLYLDQDARLSPDALRAIADALQPGTGTHFAAPRAYFERSPSWLVRAFCRYWRALPYCDASPATMGAYAVSAQGRQRWTVLPPVSSDDKFVRLLFSMRERKLLHQQSYHVVPPQNWRELIAARRRYLRSNRQLAASPHLAAADPAPRFRSALRPLQSPAAWFDFAVFLLAYAVTVVLELGTSQSTRTSS